MPETASAAPAAEPFPALPTPATEGSLSGSSKSLSSPGSLAVGMRTLVPHLGQTPFLPARNALTLSLCPLGQWNLIPIAANGERAPLCSPPWGSRPWGNANDLLYTPPKPPRLRGAKVRG